MGVDDYNGNNCVQHLYKIVKVITLSQKVDKNKK